MNRYTLTDNIKYVYTPIVQAFINKVEAYDEEGEENYPVQDLSDTMLNPFTLGTLLESLGYEKGDQDSNGWEMDFWIPYIKEGYKELTVSGSGITFELNLEYMG